MAATAEGHALTEAHRAAQGQLATGLAEEMLAVWPLLDPSDLDGTARRWLTAAVPLVERQHAAAAELTATYLTRFRAAELDDPLNRFTLPPVPGLNHEATATSLLVTGPVALRARTATGATLATAIDKTVAGVAGAAARHALTGSRDLILATIESDPKALGYRRVCSSKCCAFCAMLASRNYHGLSSDFFKSHDNCLCQPETAYHAGTGAVPRQAREFAALWADATAGVSGPKAQRNAFRRALEARRR